MRFMIGVAFVPSPITKHIIPIGHKPDFIRRVIRAENIHADKTGCMIDKVGAQQESLLDRSRHVVGDNKPAQNTNRLFSQLNQLFSPGKAFLL